jgi:hypothetical protein
LSGDITISPLSTVPGTFPAAIPPAAAKELLLHVGRPSFVNFSETYFSCVDGRYNKGTRVVATAGGDAAEFMLGLSAAHALGYALDQVWVGVCGGGKGACRRVLGAVREDKVLVLCGKIRWC